MNKKLRTKNIIPIKKICCPVFYTEDRKNHCIKVSKICFQIQHMSVQDFRSQTWDTIMEYTLQNATLEAHKKREVEVLPLRFLDGLVFHFLFTFFYHRAQNNLRHIRKREIHDIWHSSFYVNTSYEIYSANNSDIQNCSKCLPVFFQVPLSSSYLIMPCDEKQQKHSK